MSGKDHKLLWRLYCEMAEFVQTRNFRQCKSHHQRLLEEHGTIPDIICFLIKSNSKLYGQMEKQVEKLEIMEKFKEKPVTDGLKADLKTGIELKKK